MHSFARRILPSLTLVVLALLLAAPAEAGRKGKTKKTAPAAAAPTPTPAPEPAPESAPAPPPAAEPAPAEHPAESTSAASVPAAEAEAEATPRAAATSDSGAYPGPEIQRPLVLPPMMLEARGGFIFQRLSFDLGPLGGTSSTNSIGLFAGGGFGIMEGLEAGIGGGFYSNGPGLGLLLVLSPEVDIGDLPLYGMYDLTAMLGVEGLQIAARVSFNLPLQSDFAVLADAPVRFHINDMFAVIGDVGIGGQIGDADGLLIMANAGPQAQVTDMVAVSATLGMLMRAGSGSSVMVPLAVHGDFNILESLDAYVDFSFIDLNNFGADWILIQGGVAYRLDF